jgi:hypothetical protein
MLQPTLQTVMSLKASTSAMNKKKITQDCKNKISNSTSGKSYHQNIKHPKLSVYKKYLEHCKHLVQEQDLVTK